MNKKLLGHKARGSYYESLGQFDQAVEHYVKCTDLPDVWRSLALSYSDLEDLDNAIFAFQQAVDSGDNKSLPWLLELLKSHRPNDPQIPSLTERFDQGMKNGDIDLIFSLGNLHLIGGEYEDAINFWAPYIKDNHWIINRNIANLLLTRFRQLGELIPPPLGPIQSEDEALDFFMDVNEKGFKNGVPLALVEIGLRYAQNPVLEVFKEYSPNDFFDAFMESASAGHDESILLAIHFADVFADQIPDDSQLLRLVEEYGLTDFLKELNYRQALTNVIASVGSKYGALTSQSNSSTAIDKIFSRAEAAQQSGDVMAEISAWVEGSELGDMNCFHNLGVVLCNELGIVQNFFGAQGGDDKAWSALAKGIGASENRPGRAPLHKLSRLLSSNQINNSRSTYGGQPTQQLEALKPGQEASFIKICDLFEKCGFLYTKLDQNLVALPFGSRHGNFLILCELVEDDGRDLALIYSCLLTSKFNKEGSPDSSRDGLSKLQEKVLEILIRDQELIFPSMMMDIGNIFNSIPADKAPESFVNLSKAKEYWSIVGPSIASMFYEVLPTKHEYEKIEFGYGVDIGLQSDHFESAIRAIAGSITGMLDVISAMQSESPELFDLIIGYSPTSQFNLDTNLIESSELAKRGSRTSQLVMVYEEKNHDKRLEKLLALSESGMRVARRVMAEALEITPTNIDIIAGEILKEAELDENHPQVRDLLNNVGWKYDQFGNKTKAVELFEKAASLGSGNAMASLTWNLLMIGEHEKARQIFDACYYRIMTTRQSENDFEQGANSRSNDALHRFALGASHDELREIWLDAHFQENHVESKFYPILLDHLEGNESKVQEGLKSLKEREKKELIETFRSLINQHEWISDIARKSLLLLGEEPQKKKGLFRR